MIDLLNYRFTRDKMDKDSIEEMYMMVYYTKLLVNLMASYQTQTTYLSLETQMVLLLVNLVVDRFGLSTLLSMKYHHY